MSEHEKEPLVSIGLPVYNGERYLAGAIESILSQTYPHFELIICDNGSTDGTEAICNRYAAADNRVRYFRNATNLGVSRNFNLAVERASGKYFRWAADDDRIASEYLARCEEALEADPTLVLCHTQVKVIDENDAEIMNFNYRPGHAESHVPSERFRDALREDRWDFEVFGLIRTDALRRTGLMGGYVASDRVLRAELSLLGCFRILPQALFFSRDHPNRSGRASRQAGELVGRWVFPHWRVFYEYIRVANRAPVSGWQRARCYAHIASWPAIDLNWARMAADVVIAVFPSSWHSITRMARSREIRLQRKEATLSKPEIGRPTLSVATNDDPHQSHSRR